MRNEQRLAAEYAFLAWSSRPVELLARCELPHIPMSQHAHTRSRVVAALGEKDLPRSDDGSELLHQGSVGCFAPQPGESIGQFEQNLLHLFARGDICVQTHQSLGLATGMPYDRRTC